MLAYSSGPCIKAAVTHSFISNESDGFGLQLLDSHVSLFLLVLSMSR